MIGLTRKQEELLAFLKSRMKETDVSPSFEEMMKSQGLRSKSGVHRLLSALEARGHIRRDPNKARAIEIVEPRAMCAVLLSAETFSLVKSYAGSRKIGVDVAVNSIIREHFRVAA